MGNLLLTAFLVSGFTLKWNIPSGTAYGYGKLFVADIDHDTYEELIFCNSIDNAIRFYELSTDGTWILDSFTYFLSPSVWYVGDLDSDNLYDILIGTSINIPPPLGIISILESPDMHSYPSFETWRDTLDSDGSPFSVYDIDADSYFEFIVNYGMNGTPETFWIYENIGNDEYNLIWTIDPDSTWSDYPHSPCAFGDFDGDGKNEFTMGGSAFPARYWIYESPSDNTYELIAFDSLETTNIKDCFSVGDADHDGKIEYVIKGFFADIGPIHTFIFESIADNSYTIVKTFLFPFGGYNPYYCGGHSEAGDVDGDGIPEIVLEACQGIYVIKSVSNDSFYAWRTLPGNAEGSNVRIFDLDHNGLNEIIISGFGNTKIWEKGLDVTWLYPASYDTLYTSDTVNLKWRLDEIIALDSIRLYWAHPQFGCHLIYRGLPSDTICQWAVPDTQSNMAFRLWLATNGLGRYDSTYSPPFYVKRETGITEESPHNILGDISSLDAYPNPFSSKTTIRFIAGTLNNTNIKFGGHEPELKIYDVTGKLVRDCTALFNCHYNIDRISWDGSDNEGYSLPQGVYFVHLVTSNNSVIIKKLVKLE